MRMLHSVWGVCRDSKKRVWLRNISTALDRASKIYPQRCRAKAWGKISSVSQIFILNHALRKLSLNIGICWYENCKHCFAGNRALAAIFKKMFFRMSLLRPNLCALKRSCSSWSGYIPEIWSPSAGPPRLKEMDQFRKNLQKCGANNRVSFKAARETFATWNAFVGHGESFKFLGCMIDFNLRFFNAFLHRSAPIKNTSQIQPSCELVDITASPITHFNSKTTSGVWWNEFQGYTHACTSFLDKLDHAQKRFFMRARSIFCRSLSWVQLCATQAPSQCSCINSF